MSASQAKRNPRFTLRRLFAVMLMASVSFALIGYARRASLNLHFRSPDPGSVNICLLTDLNDRHLTQKLIRIADSPIPYVKGGNDRHIGRGLYQSFPRRKFVITVTRRAEYVRTNMDELVLACEKNLRDFLTDHDLQHCELRVRVVDDAGNQYGNFHRLSVNE